MTNTLTRQEEEFAPLREKMYAFNRRRSYTHGWIWLYLRRGAGDRPR